VPAVMRTTNLRAGCEKLLPGETLKLSFFLLSSGRWRVPVRLRGIRPAGPLPHRRGGGAADFRSARSAGLTPGRRKRRRPLRWKQTRPARGAAAAAIVAAAASSTTTINPTRTPARRKSNPDAVKSASAQLCEFDGAPRSQQPLHAQRLYGGSSTRSASAASHTSPG